MESRLSSLCLRLNFLRHKHINGNMETIFLTFRFIELRKSYNLCISYAWRLSKASFLNPFIIKIKWDNENVTKTNKCSTQVRPKVERESRGRVPRGSQQFCSLLKLFAIIVASNKLNKLKKKCLKKQK